MTEYFKFKYEANAGTPEIATPVFLQKKHKVIAVWDTGATSSMISAAIAKKLGLTSIGTVQIAGVHGVQSAKCYQVDIGFGNGFCMPKVKVSEASDFGGFDVLIGMDIIGRGQMIIDGCSGKLNVLFHFPVARK